MIASSTQYWSKNIDSRYNQTSHKKLRQAFEHKKNSQFTVDQTQASLDRSQLNNSLVSELDGPQNKSASNLVLQPFSPRMGRDQGNP